MKARIRVQSFPSPETDILVFHTTAQLSESHVQSFKRPIRPHSQRYLEEVGEYGAALVHVLLAMDGVTEVCIQPYEMMVRKGSAFDWIDIVPGVIDALKALYTAKYEVTADQVEVSSGDASDGGSESGRRNP